MKPRVIIEMYVLGFKKLNDEINELRKIYDTKKRGSGAFNHDFPVLSTLLEPLLEELK